MALNQRSVKATKPKKKGGETKRTVTWDEDIPAFGVRAYQGGKKSYIVRYRNSQGQDRLLTLGSASVLTVSEARKRAKDVLGAVARGEDPLEDRKRAKAQKEKDLTLSEMAERWMDLHSKPKRRSWKEDQRRLDQLPPSLGKKRADSVTALDLTRVHATIGEERGRVEANRTITTLRAVYGFFIKKANLLPGDFRNPASGVDLFKEEPRTRLVKKDEFPRLMNAIQGYSNPIVSGAILLLLFTGLRKRDVLNLRWSDIDHEAGVAILRSQKTGQSQIVPLSDASQRVLNALPRFKGNPYVFPGRVEGEPLKDIKRGWETIRDTAGCSDLRLHDFRRTLGTSLAAKGEGAHVIKSLLGHKDERTAKVYVALATSMVSGALNRYADEVEALASSEDQTSLPPGKGSPPSKE